MNEEDRALVERAYQYAEEAHRGIKRESGETYLTHPVRIALFLAKLELDVETIAAALLHDVLEDTSIAAEQIERRFGPGIAKLVSGVTKLARVRLKKTGRFLPAFLLRREEERVAFERQVESLRKMLLAMTDDIRVILIKLADRLHNMETLHAVRPDKRARIAQETLEIYAPLAYRLGMGDIKGRLEDLAFPYVYPKEHKFLRDQLGERIRERDQYIVRFQRTLKQYLESEHIKMLDIHGRVKHEYSLWQKLQRYQGDLSKIYDLIAIRIIVPTPADCYQVLGLIHSRWNPLLGRIKDYIATPKPNGYQSLHSTVFGVDGEITEIQIRTPLMHEQAEWGIAAHWHYTEHKSKKDDVLPRPSWLADLHKWQQTLKDPKELQAMLRLEFFRDQIFVFTPLGDVITLPVQSTPIDFAYAIHSDIGDNCTGAKINDRLKPLDTELKNGDIVEILVTKKPQGPKRDWLRFAKTQKARTSIKSRFGIS